MNESKTTAAKDFEVKSYTYSTTYIYLYLRVYIKEFSLLKVYLYLDFKKAVFILIYFITITKFILL